MPLFGRASSKDLAAQPPAEPAPRPLPRDVEGCRDHLLAQVHSLRPFGIGLRDACGLTLCESIASDLDLPVFTSATVDGYAVRASNLVGAAPGHPIALPLVGRSMVGDNLGPSLSAGTAVRVDAFAPVPEGADALVPLDRGVEGPDSVQFSAEAAFHDHLSLAGSRVADGDPLLSAGTVLDPRMIAMLAEVGLDKVLARPKPRAVVGAIGADLADPGLPLTRLTQTYDAATPMIAAAAGADGAQTFPIGVLPTDKAELSRALSEQLVRADLVVLAADLTPELVEVFRGLGPVETGELDMTPGGTLLFGFIGSENVPLLVLPGDTIGAYVAYEVFGRPIVRSLAGVTPCLRETTKQRVSEALPYDESRTQLLPAIHGSRGVAPIPLPADAGGVELAYANALIIVPPGQRVDVGDDADCWLLDA